MAQASTITNEVRGRVTSIMRDSAKVAGVNGLIDAMGSTDPERLAFFSDYFDLNPDYDITIADFTAAVLALREVETVYNDNAEVLARLWL